MLAATDQVRIRANEAQAKLFILRARQQISQLDFVQALKTLIEADQLWPNSARIRQMQDQIAVIAHRRDLESLRRAENERLNALGSAERNRQAELLRAAEAARVAAASSGSTPDAERTRLRDQGFLELIEQARAARSVTNFALALQLFDSALGVQPQDTVYQELAQARALAATQRRARATAETTARDQAARKEREVELEQLRVTLDAKRKERSAQDQARWQAIQDADRREYSRLLDDGKTAQSRGDFVAALAAFHAARRLQSGNEMERLITTTRTAQARAQAKKSGERATIELESRLANESAARIKLDLQAKRAQSFYAEAMKSADQALRFKQYDMAIRQYQTALKHIRTDAALNGLRLAQEDQAQAKALSESESKRILTSKQSENEAARLIVHGRASFEAGKLDEALATLRKAAELAPLNLDAIAWIAKTEHARLDKLAADRRRMGASAKAAP